MKWSVGIEAEADRVLTREQIVELADAVATSSGIATGIGSQRYGAQLLVEAASREQALDQALRRLAARAMGHFDLRFAEPDLGNRDGHRVLIRSICCSAGDGNRFAMLVVVVGCAGSFR